MAQVAVQGLRNAMGVVSSPFVRFGKAYAAAAERRPFAVGVLTTGLKTSAADLFAQMVMEKKKWHEIDGKRHLTFCIFGFTYLGAFQYFFYTKVLVWATNPITRSMGHIASAPVKTFVDQALHHPFAYFPTFYLMKYVLVGGDSVELALTRYNDELWTNCTALWKLWVPCQLLNFSVVPIHLQVPYVAAVSFVWTIILSMMRGSDTAPVEDEQTQATQATIEQTSAAAVSDNALREPSGKAADAVEEASSRAITGAGKVAEGALTAGTGVPVGGILAVASQSAEDQTIKAPAATPAPTQLTTATEVPSRAPQRAQSIEGLTAAASVPEMSPFGAHAHASMSTAHAPHVAHAPPSLGGDHQPHQPSPIAAAASMSEHSSPHTRGGPGSSASGAASVAEPLVFKFNPLGFSSSARATTTTSTSAAGGVFASADVSVKGRGFSAAGLLHLQHPLDV